MPETRHQLLQTLAAFLLGRSREMVPGHVGITIMLHDHDVDEWTASSTLRGEDLERLMLALAQHEKPRSAPAVPLQPSSSMIIQGVRWFNRCVGLVRVEMDEQLGPGALSGKPGRVIRYFIGPAAGTDEAADAQYIASWGCRFPEDAGALLFGRPLMVGSSDG